MIFKDRIEAGQKLAKALVKYKGRDAVIYALPRGGVVLGAEIAKELNAPLDIVITRKIGHPLFPEYAVCAVAEDEDMLCNEFERIRLDEEWLKMQVEKEREEAKRRREIYLEGRGSIPATDKTAIIVDDGIATGLTMLLAVKEILRQNPKEVVAAVPVAPPETAEKIKATVNELVVLDVPDFFPGAIGAYYENFPPVEDEEVVRLLKSARKR